MGVVEGRQQFLEPAWDGRDPLAEVARWFPDQRHELVLGETGAGKSLSEHGRILEGGLRSPALQASGREGSVQWRLTRAEAFLQTQAAQPGHRIDDSSSHAYASEGATW